MNKDYTIKNIKQYIDLIEQIKDNNKKSGNNADLLFRGQRVDKPLLPKLARLELKRSMANMEKLMLDEFKRDSLPLTEFKPENNWAASLKNTGVLYQTMYLVGTAMNLAPCALGNGNAELFSKAVGTDYFEESSIGEFMLGTI